MPPIIRDAHPSKSGRRDSLPDLALALGAFLFLAAVVLGLVPYPNATAGQSNADLSAELLR